MDMPIKLHEVLEFTKFFHKFQGIVRTIYVNGQERKENDAEHSYQLAMTAWFIANTQNLDLNKDLLIKYALVHDLAEVYAGDPYFISVDKNNDHSKRELEQIALKQIQNEFPSFFDIFELINEYENHQNEESKFIYSLDKILPMINELLNEGKSIKEYKLTFNEMVAGKYHKVSISEDAKHYYDMIIEIFNSDLERYFYIKD